MKRTFNGMMLIFVNNKLSVILEGRQMRTYYVPPSVCSKVSCVMRRSDPLLANQMVEFLDNMRRDEMV